MSDNGEFLSKLEPRQQFEANKLLDMEQDMAAVVNGATRFPDSMFRRQGLPILSGMLDGTFNEAAWIDFIGSAFVPLEVCADDDHSITLWSIPALFYTGRTLRQVDGQPSLSEESQNIALQAEIITSVGEQAMADMIKGTLDGIDAISYDENRARAIDTIKRLNYVFERYDVKGRIPFPEGLTEAVQVVEEKKEEAVKTWAGSRGREL